MPFSLARGDGQPGIRTAFVAALVAMLLGAACSVAPAAPGPAATSTDPAPASTAIPPLGNVSLEAASAARKVIGRDGGTVETSDARGTAYRLVIPAGALTQDTEIAVIPITDVAGLPEAAAVAGGVHLLPEGQSFWAPVELTITLGQAPAGAILPFAYSGDLSEPHRYPAPVDGSSVTFGIVHFSGYALLAATDEAMAAAELDLVIPWNPPAGPADAALAAIAPIYEATSDPDRDQKVNAIMKTWLEDGLKPVVEQFRAIDSWAEFGGQWSTAGTAASQSLLLWEYLEKLLLLTEVRLDPALSTAVEALEIATTVHGIEVTNTGCAATPIGRLVEARLPEQFLWLVIAELLGVDSAHPTLDADFIYEHLCAQVVFDPNGGTDFPSGIQAGQVGTLNLKVGLSIDGGAARFEVPMDVTITPSGASPAGVVRELTSDAGTLSHTFGWDVAAAELRLDIRGCLRYLPDACQDAFVVRGEAACPNFEASKGPHTQTSKEGVSIDGAYAFPGSAFISLAGAGTGTARTTTMWVFHSGGPASVPAILEVRAVIEDFTSPSHHDKARTASISLSGAGSMTLDGVDARTVKIPITLRDGETITLIGTVRGTTAADTGISAALDFRFIDLPAGAFVETVTCQ